MTARDLLRRNDRWMQERGETWLEYQAKVETLAVLAEGMIRAAIEAEMEKRRLGA